jgi:hypothetical protein
MTSDELKDPKARIAWLEAEGIEGFFLVSGPELVRMQEGAAMLNSEIVRWKRIMQQAYRTHDPLEVVRQIHGQKQRAKDGERFRSALLDVIQAADNVDVREIARKAFK